MTTYRKIEAEVRDDNISKTISYSKVRNKDDVVQEKIFRKVKKDREVISEMRGTSIGEEAWQIKDTEHPEKTIADYKEYSPKTLFSADKEFEFMELENKKIGGKVGGGVGGWSPWLGLVVILLLIVLVWFFYELKNVVDEVSIRNKEVAIWNDSKPNEFKKMEVLDFCQTVVKARDKMFSWISSKSSEVQKKIEEEQ